MQAWVHIGKVLVKMDIEGEEYQLLPYLLATGIACAAVDVFAMEFHLRQSKKFLKNILTEYRPDKVIELTNSFPHIFDILMRGEPGMCRTRWMRFDDESYSALDFQKKHLMPYKWAPDHCKAAPTIDESCLRSTPPAGMSRAELFEHLYRGKVYTGSG